MSSFWSEPSERYGVNCFWRYQRHLARGEETARQEQMVAELEQLGHAKSETRFGYVSRSSEGSTSRGG